MHVMPHGFGWDEAGALWWGADICGDNRRDASRTSWRRRLHCAHVALRSGVEWPSPSLIKWQRSSLTSGFAGIAVKLRLIVRFGMIDRIRDVDQPSPPTCAAPR